MSLDLIIIQGKKHDVALHAMILVTRLTQGPCYCHARATWFKANSGVSD